MLRMVTEIVEALAKITEIMNKNHSKDEAAEIIIKDSRYNKNVVAAAYSWIHEKTKHNKFTDKNKSKNRSGSFRTLSDQEVAQIGLHNYDYLLHFYNIGLITNNDFEEIVEQLKSFPEGTISQEQINLLVLALFLDLDKLTLPGSRQILYSSDTIN